jgi:hypothetical protein
MKGRLFAFGGVWDQVKETLTTTGITSDYDSDGGL